VDAKRRAPQNFDVIQTMPETEISGFLNVDLDLESSEDLTVLLQAMQPAAFCLHAECSGQGSVARLELGGDLDEADSAIGAFVALVDSLSGDARALWDRATIRDFNVGIQASSEHGPYTLAVQPRTLESAARVGARLVVSVYGATAGDG